MQRTHLTDGGWLDSDPTFLAGPARDALWHHLLADIDWRQERGRFGPTPRLTAWHADDGITYRYSGITHIATPWTPPLWQLKERLQSVLRAPFNSVLLNRYRDGRDSMGWHADDEPELGVNPVIASISLGAVRRFRLRHTASRETIALDLADGSLLVMAGTTQHHWQHSLAKTAKLCGERINLTFRQTG
jgi:alkylated DNA repair dioxygenase AlkB